MLICVKCRRELRCQKNGVAANYGNGHTYPGDLFECPECGTQVLLTNAAPYYDPELSAADEYLNMNKKPEELPGS